MSPTEETLMGHLELDPHERVAKFDLMFEDEHCVVATADEQIVKLVIQETRAAILTRHLHGDNAGDRAVIRKVGKNEFIAYCLDRYDPTELRKHLFDKSGTVLEPPVELDRADYLWIDRVLCRGQPRQRQLVAQTAA